MDNKIRALLERVYHAESIMNTALSQIAVEAQRYTDIELHGDFVAGDGAILSWDDESYNHNVIPVDDFFEEVAKNPNKHFTEDDLRGMSIQPIKVTIQVQFKSLQVAM